ncbi:EVE domain-containing protein [Yinghuangia seranimata]|uniref:EVE domain-containing protein n=1 Tax=Yinghuangia seranimata TaxID=408067 RepID=UPI00248B61D9|nr:EVE domain-containing protein [Yinghuangia seranimata]MDI2128137.1 EVE domain-containing protein [Yinghuangia seranimata]
MEMMQRQLELEIAGVGARGVDGASGGGVSLGGGRAWVGVVCREHVWRGVERGIAQLGHGKKAPLLRMSAGDWLVYYSPRTALRGGAPLQAFTAVGRVVDEVVWQADEGEFKPWRRRVEYVGGATEVGVAEFGGELALTAGPNWGYQLRRGLVELSTEDFALISAAMVEG